MRVLCDTLVAVEGIALASNHKSGGGGGKGRQLAISVKIYQTKRKETNSHYWLDCWRENEAKAV